MTNDSEEFYYSMTRDVSAKELSKKDFSVWEIFIYFVLLGGMFAAEAHVFNTGF